MTMGRIGLLAAVASTTIFNSLIAEALVSSEIEAASKILGANLVNEVSFDEGQVSLNEDARAEIRDFINEARRKGKIIEVKVAVWADKEYATEPNRLPASDIRLSEARAKAMKDYLTRDLALANVHSYNMSEKPNPLLKDLNEPRTYSSLNNEYIFTRINKSKAVLMIYLR